MPVNAAITVTSARNANVYFNVTNADKISTDPARFISGADISLTSLDIAGLSVTGKTDGGGFTALANVPSGRYSYTVSASGAQSMSGNLTVEPGVDQTLNVLLPTSMVTYTWSVTPTTIQDKYDIKLDVAYKTDVPAPAIVITPPLETIAMTGGQTAYTQYTITNKGVIAVKNFTLDTTQADPAVHVEVPFTAIEEIAAGQTITVPVKITLDHASTHEAKIVHKGGYMCAAGAWTDMTIEPWKAIVGDTSSSGNPTTGTSGSNYIGGSGGGGTGSSGNAGSISYSGVGGAVTEVVVSKTTATSVCGAAACKSDDDCKPCKVCNASSGLCEGSTLKVGFPANPDQCRGSSCKKEICKGDGSTECAWKNVNEKQSINGSISMEDLESQKCSYRVTRSTEPPNLPFGDQECTSSPNSPIISVPNPLDPVHLQITCGILDAITECKKHDDDYGKCGNGQSPSQLRLDADTRLKDNLINSCNNNPAFTAADTQYGLPAGTCVQRCIDVAMEYFYGLRLAAGMSYDPIFDPYADSHRKGCLCCPLDRNFGDPNE